MLHGEYDFNLAVTYMCKLNLFKLRYILIEAMHIYKIPSFSICSLVNLDECFSVLS